MIPNRFSYEFIEYGDCVGGGYALREDSRKGTTEQVAFSKLTDESSIYLMKTPDVDEEGRRFNRYWDLGDGWEHFDDFLYNGALQIFRGLALSRYFEITVNAGRLKSSDGPSIQTFERALALFVPEKLQELDVPGLAAEESVRGEADPVMFHSREILEELYWIVRDFSEKHSEFRDHLDGESEIHSLDSKASIRAYRTLALSYPYFEGLLHQLIDRVDLREKPYEGESGVRFKYHESKKRNTKNTIIALAGNRDVIDGYERDYLIETYYDESSDLGISRNNMAHSVYDATLTFQNIDWYGVARRLIVSILFLEEKVVYSFNDEIGKNIGFFENWLSQREQLGLESLQETVLPRYIFSDFY